MKLLFVCLGNICRSPMAEFIAKDLAKKYNLTNLEIKSAGTSGYHDGEDMHIGTKNLLKKRNIECNNFASQQINQELLNWSDYILVMDKSNYHNVLRVYNKPEKVKEIIDFCDNKNYKDIPDPWYTNNFDLVYELLNNAITNFLIDQKLINK